MATALALVLLLAAGLGGAAAKKNKKKRHKKLAKVTSVISLNETPVQSGYLMASRPCRHKRYVEIRRADNDALVASATTREDGSFGAAGGYSGAAYASTQVARKKKVRCLATRSATVHVGVADLRVSQVAVPSLITAGNPAYDVTVANDGPDAAQDVAVASTPVAQPLGAFTLAPPFTDPGCNLASGVVTCRIFSVSPGQSQTRRFALDCAGFTANFRNTARVSSSARDPDPADDRSADVLSANCG